MLQQGEVADNVDQKTCTVVVLYMKSVILNLRSHFTDDMFVYSVIRCSTDFTVMDYQRSDHRSSDISYTTFLHAILLILIVTRVLLFLRSSDNSYNLELLVNRFF